MREESGVLTLQKSLIPLHRRPNIDLGVPSFCMHFHSYFAALSPDGLSALGGLSITNQSTLPKSKVDKNSLQTVVVRHIY